MSLHNRIDEFRYQVQEPIAVFVRSGVVLSGDQFDFLVPIFFLRCLAEIAERQITKKGDLRRHEDRSNWLWSQLPAVYFRNIFRELLEEVHESDIGITINRTLEDLENSCPSELRGVLKLSDFTSQKLGPSRQRSKLLRSLIESIAHISFDVISERDAHYDEADLFELSVEILAARSKTQRAIPPVEVSQLVAKLIAPTGSEEIYDPHSGIGSLLIACVAESPASAQRRPKVFGAEKNATMWAVSRMNAFLHGLSGEKINLGESPRKTDHFEVAVSLPPWGVKESVPSVFRHGAIPFWSDRDIKLSSEYSALLEMLSVLCPEQGRMAVLMPTGSLSKSGPEKNVRRHLIEERLVEAVVGLPAKLLSNTVAPISILILRPQTKSRDVLFIDAAGLSRASRGQNRLSWAAVQDIAEAYYRSDDKDNFVRRVSIHEIEHNGFDLQASRYLNERVSSIEVDLDDIQSRRGSLLEMLEDLDRRIAQSLKNGQK
jgi:type I restriction enzyme M protein